MSFEFPKTAIADQIARVWGGPRRNVIWDGDPVPMTAPKGGRNWELITCNLTIDVGNGEDEERTDFTGSGPTQALHTTQVGTGVATVTITVTEFSNSREAFDICRMLRSRLQWESVAFALDPAGVALAEAPVVRNLNLVIDKKTIPYALLECKFNYYTKDDTTAEHGSADGTDGWIETAVTTGGPV